MRFPSCTSLGLIILLLCCYFPIAARAHGNASVSRSPIAPVDASARLSTNQLFSGLWQIKGVPEINKLTVDLPGRVFISHVSSNNTAGSSSSESAAEIKVSGNSQEVVDAVTVDCSEEDLVVAASRKPLAGEYLLVEIQLRDRNSVRKVFSDGPGDVVIGEDVLASTDIVSKVPGTSGARRLQLNGNGVGVAEAVSPGQVTAATGATGEASATTASGFTIEEVSSNADSAATQARMWMIKTTGGGKASNNVNLGLSVPGSAVIDKLRDYASSSSSGEIYAGRVVLFGDDVPGLDQVEVVSTLAADVESLQVRLKSNDSASPAATTKSFTTLIGLTAAFPITVITSESTVQIKELQKDAMHTNETLQVGNSGEGTVFVSAPKSLIVSSSVAFTAHKTGGIQVEIGKLWTTNAMSLTAMSSGTVSYFGETVSSQVWTTPSEIGNICVSADHNLNDVSVTNSYKSRVFFTGSSATTTTSSCEKLSIPERVPAETLSSEPAAATSAPGVSSGGRSSSRSTCGFVSFGPVLYLAVALMVAMLLAL